MVEVKIVGMEKSGWNGVIVFGNFYMVYNGFLMRKEKNIKRVGGGNKVGDKEIGWNNDEICIVGKDSCI